MFSKQIYINLGDVRRVKSNKTQSYILCNQNLNISNGKNVNLESKQINPKSTDEDELFLKN